MMNELAIHVQNLTKKFGLFTAVNEINFEVKQGEIFGFLGANGAGKSTAIRMMCGLLEPTSGTAIVAGHDVARYPERVKQSIGYMSQRFSLYEDISVMENIRFFGGVYGLRGKKLKERIEWVLKTAYLIGEEKRITGDLPGGLKQRLALGCALIHEPPIIFLDEPTGGVDPLSRRRFWELIQDLSEAGTTILVTTHFLDEAEYCHSIALINAGKIVAKGSPGTLKSDYLPYQIVGLHVDDPLSALHHLKALPWVNEVSLFGLSLHVGVDNSVDAIPLIEKTLHDHSIVVDQCEDILPSLEDVFMHLIEKK